MIIAKSFMYREATKRMTISVTIGFGGTLNNYGREAESYVTCTDGSQAFAVFSRHCGGKELTL